MEDCKKEKEKRKSGRRGKIPGIRGGNEIKKTGGEKKGGNAQGRKCPTGAKRGDWPWGPL